MAFFTTDPEIGSNYAMGKQDTSLAYDEPNAGMYENWFRVKVGRGKPISIDKAWYRLSDEEQSKIKKLASRVTEEDGEIILADEGHTNGIGNYEWEIKQHRGNAAAALVEGWLNSGTLYDSERDFFKVLKLAGFDMDKITYHSPYETSPAVFPVYLSIQNPLDTASIDSRVVEDLETASKKARQKKSNDADSWDKNSISPRDWMSGLREDIANGTTLSWTRIPDWVTNTLKSLGYDGIKDTGGKYHNVQHGVWIPFQPEQIKSVYNRGTFDPSDPRILYQAQQSEHAAKVHAIQSMPAQKVTPGAPLDKKAAENLARSFGKMENKRDHRVAELPVQAV